MTTPSDDYWATQGRRGGNTPDNTTSESGWTSYNNGKEQRELDRKVDESFKDLYDPNNTRSKI